ncbi:MAG: pyruvate ferredoxin oxidoreductase [Holophaga sp.]|nr:pyruvate ferredoxin oxidoreductase [Holophaga sp.]
MRQVLEGSQAVAFAVRLARTKVISAYPITPQTHIVEELAKFCADGSLDGRFLCVESEHSAMATVIGAAAGGVRTFTASSSHGLAYMHEMLHWASAARLPIVMAEVNRALGPGWNLWLDQTDSLAQRDTGWIQLYCEDSQEALDTTLQAYLLAEMVNLPVMVVLDAFFLSHTYEPVDVPDQAEVDGFLPAFQPKFQLDTADPVSLFPMAGPAVYMEMRQNLQAAMELVPAAYALIQEDFAKRFGRSYDPVDAFHCDDADVVLVMAGTTASTCREMVQNLRAKGQRVGLLKLKMFRPFPAEAVYQHLKHVPKVAVVDRNNSAGAGGIFAQELKAVLCNRQDRPAVYSYVAGLGGRDITPGTLESIYRKTLEAAAPATDSQWVGIDEELAKS